MTPTDELRKRLRALIDEKIPAGGTDEATRFENWEIDDLLTAAGSLDESAWHGWEQKADRVFSDRGGIVSSTAGDETLKFASPKELAEHCTAMAEKYKAKVAAAKGTGGSRVFAVNYPDVLGGDGA